MKTFLKFSMGILLSLVQGHFRWQKSCALNNSNLLWEACLVYLGCLSDKRELASNSGCKTMYNVSQKMTLDAEAVPFRSFNLDELEPYSDH